MQRDSTVASVASMVGRATVAVLAFEAFAMYETTIPSIKIRTAGTQRIQGGSATEAMARAEI